MVAGAGASSPMLNALQLLTVLPPPLAQLFARLALWLAWWLEHPPPVSPQGWTHDIQSSIVVDYKYLQNINLLTAMAFKCISSLLISQSHCVIVTFWYSVLHLSKAFSSVSMTATCDASNMFFVQVNSHRSTVVTLRHVFDGTLWLVALAPQLLVRFFPPPRKILQVKSEESRCQMSAMSAMSAISSPSRFVWGWNWNLAMSLDGHVDMLVDKFLTDWWWLWLMSGNESKYLG